MSEQQIPQGAGDRSREYLEEIMEKDREDRLAQPRKPPDRDARKAGLAAVLVTAFLGVVAWNAVKFAGEAPPVFTPTEERAAARFGVFLVVQGIEAFADSAGSLPENLEQLGLDEEGLTYRASGTGYEITAAAGDSILRFRRGQDLSPFAAAYDHLRGGQ